MRARVHFLTSREVERGLRMGAATAGSTAAVRLGPRADGVVLEEPRNNGGRSAHAKPVLPPRAAGRARTRGRAGRIELGPPFGAALITAATKQSAAATQRARAPRELDVRGLDAAACRRSVTR